MLPVVSSIAPVLKLWKNQLQVWDTSLNPVFDPYLSYETAVTGLRNYKTNIDLSKSTVFPILAYNRTTLVPSEGLNLRATEWRAKFVDGDTGTQYVATLGQFDIDFLYIHPNEHSIERFEILYNAQLGIQTKKLTLNLGSLGSFGYQVYWDLLNPNIQLSAIRDSYYKMISGTCRIFGPFFAISDTSYIITQVNTTIVASYLDYPYKWDQIYPTDINVTNNTIDTVESWATGTPIKFRKNWDTQTLPVPIVEGMEYYAINAGTAKIKLATSKTNAEKGIAINITSIGDVTAGTYFIMYVSL
jgi:hypothetical protein